MQDSFCYDTECVLPGSECACVPFIAPKPIIQEVFEWLAIVILVCLSASFSGLNLGILSLEISSMEIISKGDPESEGAKYAKALLPIRIHHNWIICTLLIGNVMVNSATAILLSSYTSGTLGFFLSTAILVVFGEIIPQALCSRYPLLIGYKLIPLIKAFMFILSPLAYPLSLALNYFLGAPLANVYTNDQLAQLLEMHNDEGVIDDTEVKIMHGALEIKHLAIEEVMKPIDQLFMLEENEILDEPRYLEVLNWGYSRIPVYRQHRTNVTSLLLLKDLILISPSPSLSVGEVSRFFGRECLFFRKDTKVSECLQAFSLHRSHCGVIEAAFSGEDQVLENPDTEMNIQSPRPVDKKNVDSATAPDVTQNPNSESSSDIKNVSKKRIGGLMYKKHVFKAVGLVTLEDIIEEIFDQEIEDEHDMDETEFKVRKKPSSVKLRSSRKHVLSNIAPRDLSHVLEIHKYSEVDQNSKGPMIRSELKKQLQATGQIAALQRQIELSPRSLVSIPSISHTPVDLSLDYPTNSFSSEVATAATSTVAIAPTSSSSPTSTSSLQ